MTNMGTKIRIFKRLYLCWTACVVVFVVMGFLSIGKKKSLSPEEYNRVYSTAGFSMICPSNWNVENISIPDKNFYAMYFRTKNGRIYEAFSIECSKTEPMVKPTISTDGKWNEKTTLFLGIPSTEYHYYSSGIFLDHSSKTKVYICFKRGGYWYKIGYTNRGTDRTIPHHARTFFNTLRFSDDNGFDISGRRGSAVDSKN